MNTLTTEPGQLTIAPAYNLGTQALAFVHVSIALDSSAITTQDQIDFLQVKSALRQDLVDSGYLRPLPAPGETPPPPPGETPPPPPGETPITPGDSQPANDSSAAISYDKAFVQPEELQHVLHAAEANRACDAAPTYDSSSADSSASDCSASASGD